MSTYQFCGSVRPGSYNMRTHVCNKESENTDLKVAFGINKGHIQKHVGRKIQAFDVLARLRGGLSTHSSSGCYQSIQIYEPCSSHRLIGQDAYHVTSPNRGGGRGSRVMDDTHKGLTFTIHFK